MWGHAINETEIIRSLVRGNVPASPRSVDPTVPEAIDAMCARALAINPDDRYATAAELEAELSAFLAKTGERPSDRELGRYVSELFAETRRDARKIIESQLSQLASLKGVALQTVPFPPASFTPTHSAQIAMAAISQRTPKLLVKDVPQADPEPTLLASPLVPPSVAARTGRRAASLSSRARLLFGIGLALGALALVVVAWQRVRRRDSPNVVPVVATAPADSSASSTVHSPPLPEITVTLRASPAEARFSLDDGPLLPNPFVGHQPKDGARHRVTVMAPGYVSLHKMITYDDDVMLQLSLGSDPSLDAATPARGLGSRLH
jgi:serine/threonine-protein kinase